MSADPFGEADLERIARLPRWAQDLFTTARGRIASLEDELAELRAATEQQHEGSEVRLVTTHDEVSLPAGAEIAFDISDRCEVDARVEAGALRLSWSGEVAIVPVDSISVELREVPARPAAGR